MFSVVPAIPLQKCDGEEEWTPEMVRQIQPKNDIFTGIKHNICSKIYFLHFFLHFFFSVQRLLRNPQKKLTYLRYGVSWDYFLKAFVFLYTISDSANTQNILQSVFAPIVVGTVWIQIRVGSVSFCWIWIRIQNLPIRIRDLFYFNNFFIFYIFILKFYKKSLKLL